MLICIFLIVFIVAEISLFVLMPHIRFTEHHPVLERTNEYHASDFVAKANGEVTWENDVLFTEETGEYSARFTVKKWNFSREYDLVYRVEDTTPPEISFHESVIYRNPEEDFDSDDWDRKRTVIKALGADLKLSGRTIVFTPVKYLVPVAKSHDKLEAKKEAARTAPEQIKKDLEEDLISEWCAVSKSLRTSLWGS